MLHAIYLQLARLLRLPVRLRPGETELAWALQDGNVRIVKEKRFGSAKGPLLQGVDSSSYILTEFLADVLKLRDRGILVTHGMECKAAALRGLLLQHGMAPFVEFWSATAASGLCLMSPTIRTWLEICADTGSFHYQSRLQCQKRLAGCVDRAAAALSATLYLDIICGLRVLATPPCCSGEAPHDLVSWDCGPRDNGEHVLICRACGRTV